VRSAPHGLRDRDGAGHGRVDRAGVRAPGRPRRRRPPGQRPGRGAAVRPRVPGASGSGGSACPVERRVQAAFLGDVALEGLAGVPKVARPAAARRSRRGPRPPRRTGPCSPPPRSSAGRRSRPRPRTPRAPRRTPSPPGPRPPLHHRGCPRHRHRCSRRDRRPGPRQPPARRDDSVTGARTRGTSAGDPQAAGHRPLTGRYADTSDGGCRTSRDSSNDLLTRTCVPLRVGVASPRRREPPVSWIRL
jgi:hypothetical protein